MTASLPPGWPGLGALVTLLGLAGCGGSTDATPPAGFTTTHVVLKDAQVEALSIRYPSGGLSVAGILCRPLTAGAHALVMLNHGGWAGLGTELDPTASTCVGLARSGFVVIEPSYRGEDGSDGTIELCLGEATDIRSMLTLALARSDVDPTKVAVIGGSHGACSSLRAIVDGLEPVRVVAQAGPTDWAAIYRAFEDSLAAGVSGARLDAYTSLAADVRRYLGGTPDQAPVAYAARGLVTRVTGLDHWGGAVLVQHGVDDDIVPVEQSCALGVAAAGFIAYHVDPNGQVVTTAPGPCAGLPITWSVGPLPATWADRRYLVIYDAMGHGTGLNAARALADAVSFLRLTLP